MWTRRILFPLNLVTDRQQVFRYPHEPLGIPVNSFRQRSLILRGQLLFEESRASPQNGGKRSADIVGNGPQQIGMHFLPFHRKPELFLWQKQKLSTKLCVEESKPSRV